MNLHSTHGARMHGEGGITVLEMVIATALISLALVVFLSSLSSSESTNEFAASRNRSLDELRLAAAAFTRDARQASSASSCSTPCSSVTLATYANGVFKPSVVWKGELNTATGQIELLRTDGTNTRRFPSALTTGNVFRTPSPTTIVLKLATKPKVKFPPVVLETEVALRNVTP